MIKLSEISVTKSKELYGDVNIGGSKNSALPILAATIAVEGKIILENIPDLSDVAVMTRILRSLGCIIIIDNEKLEIISDDVYSFEVPYDLSSRIRASFLISGAMLSRFGKVRIAMPGGCAIGSRPVDLHIKGLELLGADVRFGNGYIDMESDGLKGADIYLDFPSVGATENIMIAACLAEGKTEIINAATEPEVSDLANFLNRCGADIRGIGTENLAIFGTKNLKGCNYRIIPDRIEAGTFMIATAIAGGKITINNICIDHLAPVCSKLKDMGVETCFGNDNLTVARKGDIFPASIKTMPHPGFPTDMQSLFSALMCYAYGTSMITETVFENRYMHLAELTRMNAIVRIDGRCAVIEGKRELSGATVSATDLRSGAALVLAGLGANGNTRIKNAELIDRGYDNFVHKLRIIGADVKYVDEK